MDTPSFKKAMAFWLGIAGANRTSYLLLRRKDGGRFCALNRKYTGVRDNPEMRKWARKYGMQVVGVCGLDGTFRPNRRALKGA